MDIHDVDMNIDKLKHMMKNPEWSDIRLSISESYKYNSKANVNYSFYDYHEMRMSKWGI